MDQEVKFEKFQVKELDDIRKGDHLAVKRHLPYRHHMIVEENPTDLTEVKVIEYGNKLLYALSGTVKSSGSSGVGKAVIRRQTVDLSTDVSENKVRRLDYDPDESYTHDETVIRAQNKLGETRYNWISNNCEHFATWCRTGVYESSQVERFFKVMFPLRKRPKSKQVAPADTPVSARTRSVSQKRKLELDPQISDPQNVKKTR
ncbi:PREDICTED: uncharacterized protein LOC109467593 [Branchiostoma belcheri]|uniref:Uncharacterized protein LOC109467593 n=1 Tax=Branchiostoma belcheri TaxID=7741 RepID=A0A6P4Y9M5_BRABE|nr:PREDICTED: uncharacterized protein LOC109467593 [Branchiostoma belcheri]